jgi:hypothetical protein
MNTDPATASKTQQSRTSVKVKSVPRLQTDPNR